MYVKIGHIILEKSIMMCLIYFYKGATLTTKKSIDHKAIIQKRSKDFGGSFEDPDIMNLHGRSRNNYYK